jgi:hypothetical protein
MLLLVAATLAGSSVHPVAAVEQVCAPFLERRISKSDAEAAAKQLGFKSVGRPGADFVFLVSTDVWVSLNQTNTVAECGVSVENMDFTSLAAAMAASADKLGWIEVGKHENDRLWLTRTNLVALVDETYGGATKKLSVIFQPRGAAPQVGGRPADPLAEVVKTCILHAKGLIDADALVDLGTALGLQPSASAGAETIIGGYGVDVAVRGESGKSGCAIVVPGMTPAKLRQRAKGWEGVGYSLTIRRAAGSRRGSTLLIRGSE